MPTRNPQTDVTPVSFLVAPSSDLLGIILINGFADQCPPSQVGGREFFKKIDRKELCEFQVSKWSSITQFFFRIKKRTAHIVWERNLHRNHTKGPKSHGPRVYFEIRCMIVDPSLGGWQLEFIDVHFLESIQTWAPICSPAWQDTVQDWEHFGWADDGRRIAEDGLPGDHLRHKIFRWQFGAQAQGTQARVRFCKMLGARANAVREVPGCVVTRWPEAYRSFGHPRQLLFRYIPVWESASTEFLVDKIHQIPTPSTFELPKFCPLHLHVTNTKLVCEFLSGPAGNSTRSSVSSNDKECSTWRSQEVNQGCSTWCSMLSSGRGDPMVSMAGDWLGCSKPQFVQIGKNPSKSPTCRGLGCVAKDLFPQEMVQKSADPRQVSWRMNCHQRKNTERTTTYFRPLDPGPLPSASWSPCNSATFASRRWRRFLELSRKRSPEVCLMCLIVCCFKAVIKLKQI